MLSKRAIGLILAFALGGPTLGLTGCRSASKSFIARSASTSKVEAMNAESETLQAAYQTELQAAETDQPRLPSPKDQDAKLPKPKSKAEKKDPADSEAGAKPETIKKPAKQPPAVAPEESDLPQSLKTDAPLLLEVVQSVRNHFPLIQQAAANRIIASGEALSASGAFDHKLEGYTNVQPLDFYENHWQKWGVKRDTMWGGQVGAGYRSGRGSFEPWYKERETNDLGEFGLSLTAPIIRDRAIDANRAELWRAQLERGRVEPVIRAQVIMAVREGAQAYWQWVAAGENYRIAEGVLELGLNRVEFLTKQVKAGEKAEIDLIDNRRIIVSRQAKLIDARRKFEQAAVKLSLYLRTPAGEPLRLDDQIASAEFPKIATLDPEVLATDIALATRNRPELDELTIVRQQLAIALRQACNETRPDIDGGLYVAQDVGNPTKDRDKSEFELEATLTVSVPLERRKARGKVRQLRGKLAQLQAKTQFASEKISAEVQIARAALLAAIERVEQTTEGVKLAERMQAAERRLYEEGQSTLFNLNLREKQTAEAAVEQVAAQLDFFLALADYTASLGLDGATLDAVYAVQPE